MQGGFNLMRSAVKYDRRTASPTAYVRSETLSPQTPLIQPRIDCIWHENLPAYMAHYLPPPPGQPTQVWMSHPAWRMRPIHVWLRWNGVGGLVLGSTGHGGQVALDSLAEILMKNDGQLSSTMFAVDGPSGPVREVKRGALDLALMTGLPLVGISFRYKGASVRALGWDRKYYPIPFLSAIGVCEGSPIHVTELNYDQSRRRLKDDLG